jgi:hypothetical protein
MAAILLLLIIMATTPAPTVTTAKSTKDASTSQASSPSMIEIAGQDHNRIFAAYVFVLVLTVMGTIWVWTSGNRVQDLIRADADARISEAHVKIEELTNENLKLQHMLMPRRIKLVTKDSGDNIRLALQQEVAKHANTFAVIQYVPDFDSEALASNIRTVLIWLGWKTDIVDESRSGISWRNIEEGVTVVTAESRPFDLNKNARTVVTSKAGEAAKAVVELLRLDLAMPFGQSAGVEWKPTYSGRLLPFRYGDPAPKADVLILVGMKPVEGILGGHQATPTVNSK